MNQETEVILPERTPLLAALASIADEGGRGCAVLVPAASMPMLRRAYAPHVLHEGDAYYRFPPPQAPRSPRGSFPGRLLAALALLPLAPFLLFLSLLLLLLNGTPILFRQARVGRHGVPFTLYKFRSLDASPPRKALRLGMFLRRHGLDEIPQIWNILAGEMAWFGPRPLPCSDPAPRTRWFLERETVPPGLTGLYQTCPGRRGLRIEEMAALDLFFLRNDSPSLRLRILFRTLPAVLLGWGRQHARRGRAP